MPAPMPVRDFINLIAAYDCYLVKSSKEWKVYRKADGTYEKGNYQSNHSMLLEPAG